MCKSVSHLAISVVCLRYSAVFDKQFPLPDCLILDKKCCNFQPLNPAQSSPPTLASEG